VNESTNAGPVSNITRNLGLVLQKMIAMTLEFLMMKPFYMVQEFYKIKKADTAGIAHYA